jgi:surface antigen/peptidoglycan hydrolase CwlO-like protein
VAVLTAGLLPISMVKAATQAELNDVRDQLNEIRDKISNYEAEARRLAATAGTLANQIALLKVEENKLVAQIELSEARHDELVIEIEATSKRIDTNLEMIGHIVAQFYYNDGVSTLERLASADNLASFIDEEARLSNLSDTLSGIVTENKSLKAELEVQRKEVEEILMDLEVQKAALVAKRAEQQRLLAETRNQESIYQEMKKEATTERERLEAEQQRILWEIALANGGSGVTPGDPNKGGYPYSSECPAAKWNGKQYGDKWGMYICECVSYTAWKVYQYYGNMPYWGGKGNANQWLASAKAAGIPTGTVPKVGSVGVNNSGPWGHVVWVEAVNGNKVYISQYNSANAATNWKSGEYSEMWVNATAYDGFIYFGER